MISNQRADWMISPTRRRRNTSCSNCGEKMDSDDPFDASEAAEFEYISIHVRNPRTHILRGWPVYTDYEIVVLTNSTIFAKQNTHVRRRFSEFAWLWKQMSKHTSYSMKLPSLPTKTRLFGRFGKNFLEERRDGLQAALASLTRITPILADVAFHLFLQSTLSIKDMESVLSGKDKRDILEIISPRDTVEPQFCEQEKCNRKSTCQSTGDSGFSGSVKPDDLDEKRGILDGVSSWVTSQQNYASSSLMGNGWSSGYTCRTTKNARSDSRTRTCPECLAKLSPQVKRRTSLSHDVAAVLPGGQLVVAPTGDETDGASCEHHRHTSSGGSKTYDGDDEVEFDLADYDVIKDEPIIRVRNWLRSQNEKSDCDNSDEEEESGKRSPRDVRLNEYDVISVPCSGKPSNCVSTQSMGYHSNKGSDCEEGEVAKEEDDDSAFSVLHSSIDRLDWKDRDEMTSSCDSLNSAALFLTYDVVEMIELRFNNVV